MKRHFRNFSEGKLFYSNRNFWKIITPFLTSKGFIANSDISLKEGNEIITTDTQSAFTCLKLTIETLEQGVKYVQS